MKKYLIIVLLAFGLTSCSSGPENYDTGIEARVMVWQVVRNRLRYAPSAEFSTLKMEQTQIGSWKTTGYVDSQNQYGATTRLYFRCELKHKYGTSWDIVELTFNQ